MGEEVAFISDIHSNLEALEAVIRDIGNTRIVCLGDIVGYGANPRDVLKRYMELRVQGVMGNHDHAVITKDTSWFNAAAARAIIWTERNLGEFEKGILKRLPTRMPININGRRFLAVHGSPDDPLYEYVTPLTHEGLFDYYLERNGVECVVVGHTHLPFEWRSIKGTVFNPGSVGQPRDGIPKASYAIVEVSDTGIKVEHRRIDYDIEAAAGKIVKAGLPDFLARRLFSGI